MNDSLKVYLNDEEKDYITNVELIEILKRTVNELGEVVCNISFDSGWGESGISSVVYNADEKKIYIGE